MSAEMFVVQVQVAAHAFCWGALTTLCLELLMRCRMEGWVSRTGVDPSAPAWWFILVATAWGIALISFFAWVIPAIGFLATGHCAP